MSWERGAAPAIPSTKEGLLTSLQAHGAVDVGGLNKTELRHHFCTLIRGRQSPSDPTTRTGRPDANLKSCFGLKSGPDTARHDTKS